MKKKPYISQWWVQTGGYEWISGLVPTEDLVALRVDPDGTHELEIGYDDPELGLLPPVEDEAAELRRRWLAFKELRTVADGRDYDPLRIPDLHRKFARLNGSEEGILQFASEFGFLGRQTRRLISTDGAVERWGEPLTHWHDEIHKMRVLLELFDALFRDKPQTREERWSYIRFDEEQVHFGLEDAEFWQGRNAPDVFGLERLFPDPLKHLPSDERYTAGCRLLLRDAINYELEQGARIAVELIPGSQVRLIPNDLLGAMFVLFAQEAIGQSPLTIKCRACGRWFLPGDARQIYCDDRCKFKAYRQRRKEVSGGK